MYGYQRVRRINQKPEIKIYTLLYVKGIANKDLLPAILIA